MTVNVSVEEIFGAVFFHQAAEDFKALVRKITSCHSADRPVHVSQEYQSLRETISSEKALIPFCAFPILYTDGYQVYSA